MINLIALAIPVFFAMIGVELLVARWLGRRVYRFDDAITDLGCGITSQVIGVFTKIVPVGAYVWAYGHRLADLDATAVGTHVVAFLGVDLAYYAWHRFTHVTNVGWATHVVHHQSEDYNLAVALRQSMTSSLSSWPFYLPLAVIGVPPVVFFTHSALNTLYQFWIHTETVRTTGPLEWVLNTPAHHRVHHGINPRYIDKNYAGVLIVWDRLFGTFEPESEPAVYGTVEPLNAFDPFWANVAFGWGMVKDAAAARTVGDRLRVLFAHPGWRPAGLPAHPTAQPVHPDTFPKYAPRGRRWRGRDVYVTAQFVPTALAVTALLAVEDSAPVWVLAAIAGMVCWTVAAWSLLFEARGAVVRAVELARLAAMAGLGAALGLGDTVWAPAGWALVGWAAVSVLVFVRFAPSGRG